MTCFPGLDAQQGTEPEKKTQRTMDSIRDRRDAANDEVDCTL
jgi:hypothetical protein